MKNPLIFIIPLSLLFIGCSDDDEIQYQEIEDTFIISCPEPPIEILSNLDEDARFKGEGQLSYFCIIKESTSKYYMYYETYNNMVVAFKGQIKFAYSIDGLHWERKIPDGYSNDNIIISNGVEGVSVVKIPDTEFPYRMFGYGEYGENRGIYMWKSQDGMHFTREGMVLEGTYDTQQVAVLKGDRIKIFTRLWSNDHKNRKIGVFYVNFDGNLISSPVFLQDNYMYNSAASILDDVKYDFLFPTYFNNMMGSTDEAYIKALIVDGYNSKEIQCDINRWIEPEEPWVLVSPGIIDIAGEKYIAYQTNSWSHDAVKPDNGITKYKLMKIHIR